MAVNEIKEENILLGSGKLYIAELVNGAIPALATILSTAGNCVGDIQGGAELNYKPTLKRVLNDEKVVRKVFITDEEVTLKSGVLTWALPNMEKITVGAAYDSTSKKITIGGKKSVKQYAIVFVSNEQDFGFVAVTMKGCNTSGWTLKFDPENESVVDTVFEADKQNGGVLVEISQYAELPASEEQ